MRRAARSRPPGEPRWDALARRPLPFPDVATIPRLAAAVVRRAATVTAGPTRPCRIAPCRSYPTLRGRVPEPARVVQRPTGAMFPRSSGGGCESRRHDRCGKKGRCRCCYRGDWRSLAFSRRFAITRSFIFFGALNSNEMVLKWGAFYSKLSFSDAHFTGRHLVGILCIHSFAGHN
jgi:hypothetical protein